jgi:hypothetical protein
MAGRSDKLEHLFPRDVTLPRAFTTPQARRDPDRAPEYPVRANPAAHVSGLIRDLKTVEGDVAKLNTDRQAVLIDDCAGVFVDVKFVPNADFPLKSLTDERPHDAGAHIELVTVTELGPGLAQATLFVPDGRLKVLERKIQALVPTDPAKAPRNVALVSSLDSIRRSVARSFWTDSTVRFPSGEGEFWWEVWLRRGVDPSRFRRHATILTLHVSPRELHFPDRTVLLVRATVETMTQSAELLDSIAELRGAAPLDLEFLDLDSTDEREIVSDLGRRVVRAPDGAMAVCLLDTGVDFDHELLKAALPREDVHTCFGEDMRDRFAPGGDWHGTGAAGLALYGDHLAEALVSREPWQHGHHLESVKYIPSTGHNDPDLYGEVTQEAIARVEGKKADRPRVIVTTVSAARVSRGEPTSWSSAVDQLASGADSEERVRRLIVLSAGNVMPNTGYSHPDRNHLEVIEDPGQAWNALTVGAYTERTVIAEREYAGYSPIAPGGHLAPASRTSLAWIEASRQGPPPFKPDFVCEGGNWARETASSDPVIIDSLTPLSTRRRDGVGSRVLARFGATSAAAALGGNLAAQLHAQYPALWPETIRALLVHSCRYTPAMEQCFDGLPRRKRVENLLRCFGYGVPDLERARYSARNELTLVLEREIQPFRVDVEARKGKTNEMHLHRLPWPTEVLEALGALQMRLRVTLSYFVEPNPGKRGVAGDARTIVVDPARYPSYGLRFEVTTAGESPEDLLLRVNGAERAEDQEVDESSDMKEWDLGRLRSRGSLHSDVWRGSAVRLADKYAVAVCPVNGWWRFRHRDPEICKRKARYALIVSIETDDEEIDVYTPVLNQVAIER